MGMPHMPGSGMWVCEGFVCGYVRVGYVRVDYVSMWVCEGMEWKNKRVDTIEYV